MSQTVMRNQSLTVFQGLLDGVAERIESYIAGEELTVGRALTIDPDAAANLDADPLTADHYVDGETFVGILMAETSLPSVNKTDTIQLRAVKDVVPVVRQGRVWIEIPAAITDLSAAVLVNNAVGADAGKIRFGAAANYITLVGATWKKYRAENSKHYGLVEINLP